MSHWHLGVVLTFPINMGVHFDHDSVSIITADLKRGFISVLTFAVRNVSCPLSGLSVVSVAITSGNITTNFLFLVKEFVSIHAVENWAVSCLHVCVFSIPSVASTHSVFLTTQASVFLTPVSHAHCSGARPPLNCFLLTPKPGLP